MDRDSRLDFLSEFLPEFEDYYNLLADFRFGGYRVLGDLICDIDDENNATERKKLLRSNDSKEFKEMMQAYYNKSHAQSYRQAVANHQAEKGSAVCGGSRKARLVVGAAARRGLYTCVGGEEKC